MNSKKKFFVYILMLLLPIFAFAASDDFIVPFKTLLTTWMSGSVGMTIAFLIMIISVIWGAAGGGFPIIGKGFILSIFVGAILFFAEKAFSIGAGFVP